MTMTVLSNPTALFAVAADNAAALPTVGRLAIYIAVMAGMTYLIRMLPFTLFRREIRSTFFRSFLCYVPYAVLGAMTFPSVFYATGSLPSAIGGTIVALVLAFCNRSLLTVALGASGTALAVDLVMVYLLPMLL